MTEKRRTENDRLRRRLYNRARSESTTVLRNKYPREWRVLLAEVVAEFPDVSWSTQYSRAEQRLRRAHWHEFTTGRVLLQDRMETEAGYRPFPKGGHFTGRNAKPVGHPARVDFDAHLEEDAS